MSPRAAKPRCRHRSPGRLKEVLIEEGEQVKAGQVLARLDDTAQQAALAQAQAQLKAAVALLRPVPGAARAGATRSEAQRRTLDADAVSRQAAEQAQTQVDTLVAQVAAQEKQSELAQAGIEAPACSSTTPSSARRFPASSSPRRRRPGEIVSPISAGGGFTRTGVGTIVDMDSLEIDVDVNEAYINRVQPRQSARGGARCLSGLDDSGARDRHHPDRGSQQGHRQSAHRHRSEGSAHPARHGRERVVSRGRGSPRSGCAAQAAKGGVLVPASAVVERDGHSVVFVIEGDHAHVSAACQPGPERRICAWSRD